MLGCNAASPPPRGSLHLSREVVGPVCIRYFALRMKHLKGPSPLPLRRSGGSLRHGLCPLLSPGLVSCVALPSLLLPDASSVPALVTRPRAPREWSLHPTCGVCPAAHHTGTTRGRSRCPPSPSVGPHWALTAPAAARAPGHGQEPNSRALTALAGPMLSSGRPTAEERGEAWELGVTVSWGRWRSGRAPLSPGQAAWRVPGASGRPVCDEPGNAAALCLAPPPLPRRACPGRPCRGPGQ